MPAKGRCTVLYLRQILSISYSLFPLLTFKTRKMKKFLGTTAFVMLTLFTLAQGLKTKVSGTLTDALSKAPIAGAQVKLGNANSLTDENGYFQLGKFSKGSYTLQISSLGYKTSQSVLVIEDKALDLSLSLTPTSLYLQPLEVKATRAASTAPFAKTNLSKEQIAANNLGQDLPYLLNQTPSVVVNSDAGNGVGYTGIRIRGSDATRINLTLNGIPYNDAESMGTFFVNIPDFASSVNSIQIQRGVGTSTNGAAAFGASLNLSTNEYNEKAYGEMNTSIGSFNTWKSTIKGGSGLIAKHFTIDARVSSINSNGFIDRAASNLKSMYLSMAYLNEKSSLRFNVFTGKEKTYQAWYGVPEALLERNRRFNPAGMEKTDAPYENQTDNYSQTHYQLFFNHAFNQYWSFNTAVFLTNGNGYYEEYKADQSYSKYGLSNPIIAGVPVTTTDLVRQRWLDNSFLGQIGSFQYKKAGEELTIGGGWNKYQGQHFGNIVWMKQGTVSPDYRYYDLPAIKKDANIYVKWQHHFNSHWQSFIDLQYRSVSHKMEGFQGNPNLTVDRSFDFVNPKAGITYSNNGWLGFLSYAFANKEPNRDDFQASPIQQPKPESLQDLELGIEKRKGIFQYSATLYWMQYQDQLVLTGQINDVGAYTRTNVPKSYRLGLELQAGARVSNLLSLSGNFTISKNKIKSFTEFIDNWDNGLQNAVNHENTDISFSPSLVGALTADIQVHKHMALSLLSKYVGKQYLDNSQSASRKLNAYFTQDLRLNWTIRTNFLKEMHVIGQLNNLFNAKYEPNGYTYSYISGNVLSNDNGYYPQAGTNFMIALNIRL
jgi:iron complex outermembrane recepter protein